MINLDDMRELVDKLNYYTKLYDEGHPEISDKEFDDLYFKLQEMEKDTGIVLANSPTNHIDYQVVNMLTKVTHNHPMVSLAKTKSTEEVAKFLDGYDGIAMAKMDGLTCSLRYLDGKLVSAETRGNGEIGEDITHNIFFVQGVPTEIPIKEEVIVDGEVICTYSDFKEFSNEYANPRNFAAGSIRLLNSAECAKRKLTFVAWDCIKGLEEEPREYYTGPFGNKAAENVAEHINGKIKQLNKLHRKLSYKLYELCEYLGFYIAPYIPYIKELEHTEGKVEHINLLIKETAKELGYPIDGVVYKYDDCDLYSSLGMTAHHPRAALAFKFYDEEYETYLRDIEWSMGKTG
jgi:DNA ligase (NAD+)